MRKNWLIISIFLCLMMFAALVIFLVKTELDKKEEEETKTLVSNTGTKIMKVEGDTYLSYIVEDYERNLTYSWSFPKDESFDNNLYIDLNLRLNIDAITENTKEIEEKVDQNKLIVTFDYHGILPNTATIRIDVSEKFEDGKELYLYYYNPDNNQIEYIDHKLKVEHGYVEFSIDHCSDYFLTGTIVQDAINNPKNINYIIIGMGVVVLILLATTLRQSKK